jgi:carbonic anhydrase/acetyltransferase-like protein (isoleucine patch superfamily)
MINGNCKIGEGVFIGSRTVLRENINIKSKTIIGFGKVIGRSKI